jgi:hypothetical protein
MVNSDLQVSGSIAADDESYLELSVSGPAPTFDLKIGVDQGSML